jgi:hypothetical protein
VEGALDVGPGWLAGVGTEAATLSVAPKFVDDALASGSAAHPMRVMLPSMLAATLSSCLTGCSLPLRCAMPICLACLTRAVIFSHRLVHRSPAAA